MDVPKIYFRKTDLEKHRDMIISNWSDIECQYINKNVPFTDDQYYAYQELYYSLEAKTIKFPEIELIVVDMEYSSGSDYFKFLLDHFDIEYIPYY